jgi:hypothetical protein
METILRKEHPNGTLYYTDKLDSGTISWIKEYLQKKKFINITRKDNHRIRLSGKEKEYLDSSINKLYSICWKDSLYENSRSIPVDSMWTHIQKKNREFSKLASDAAVAGKTLSINNRVNFSNTFQFTFPIYFRDRSIFLLYFIRLCGGECGVQELAFYKLENGHYEKWISVNWGEF